MLLVQVEGKITWKWYDDVEAEKRWKRLDLRKCSYLATV
jgi:hypothetical protein